MDSNPDSQPDQATDDFEIEFDALMALGQDDLLQLIGEDILGTPLGMLNHPGDALRKAAGKWWAANRDALKETICQSTVARVYFMNPKRYDRLLLAAALVDLIWNQVAGVSPAVVVVMVMKEGLETFCTLPDRHG